MAQWVAVAFGALDVREHKDFPGVDIVLLPVVPSEPIGIAGETADLWKRLVAGPVDDEQLSEGEAELVREFAAHGIASDDIADPNRIIKVSEPWFTSPMHELVSGLVASVAASVDVPSVFIKGPLLREQGLRTRVHSGDVDVWVQPSQLHRFVTRMMEWGWIEQPNAWAGTVVNHSTTLEPTSWGCEIDVHRRMPGSTLSDEDLFVGLDALTEHRIFAGVSASVPRQEASAVLFAMHAVRPMIGRERSEHSAGEASRALEIGGPGAARAAEELGAVVVLLPSLRETFPDGCFISEGQPNDWEWRGKDTKFGAYLAALRVLPVGQRVGVAWRLVWPSREFVLASARIAGKGEQSALRARLQRFRRGLRRGRRR